MKLLAKEVADSVTKEWRPKEASSSDREAVPLIDPGPTGDLKFYAAFFVPVIVGVLLLVFIVYAIWWSLQTYNANGSVSSMKWEQRVHKDNWQELTKQDWQENLSLRRTTMPTNGPGESAGIDNIRGCTSKYHHTRHYVCGSDRVCHDATKQVANGESCHDSCSSNHNGSRTCHEVCSTKYKTVHYDKCGMENRYCDERITKQWCLYDTWQWQQVDVATRSGADSDPQWADVSMGPLDRLRRDADYRVDVSYRLDGEKYETFIEPKTEAEFRTWHRGDPATVVIYNVGAVSEVKHPTTKETP